MPPSWLSARDLNAPGLRLFCFPHAGAGASNYYAWKRFAPPALSICPVLLPGRESRFSDTLLYTVADVIDAFHHEAAPLLHERPYAILGHSMGSLLAYEWARKIRTEALPPPQHLFISGRNAPHAHTGHSKLHQAEESHLLTELEQRYGSTQAALMADPEMRALFLPILRADLSVVETYTHTHPDKLACPITALAGEDDPSVSPEGLALWAETTTGAFATKRLPGNHFYLGTATQPLLQAITQTLSR